MSAADGIRFVMDMLGWVVGMQHQMLDIRSAEMKHTGLVVIDPYDSVKMAGHKSLP